MPDEKANNPFSWRNKLDQLTGMPGEAPADQAAAWQKLHDRLQQKTHQKKTTGYWIAAACLLCVLVLSWLVWVQPDDRLVKNPQPKHENSPQPFQNINSPDAVAVSLQQGLKKKPMPSLESKKTLHPALMHVAVINPLVLTPDTIKNILQPIVIPQPGDTVRLTAAVPVKKKLRVVHINELNNAREDTLLAGNNPESSPGKLLRGDDLSGFSLSRNASDNIVKIKLSSSN